MTAQKISDISQALEKLGYEIQSINEEKVEIVLMKISLPYVTIKMLPVETEKPVPKRK